MKEKVNVASVESKQRKSDPAFYVKASIKPRVQLPNGGGNYHEFTKKGASLAKLPPVHKEPNLSGIVLAGGDGKRLQPLIRRLRGDMLPKQFVNFIGTRSTL